MKSQVVGFCVVHTVLSFAAAANGTPLRYLIQNPLRQVTAYNAATNATLVFGNFRYMPVGTFEPWNPLNPVAPPLDPEFMILPEDIEVETSGSPPGIIFRPSVDWSVSWDLSAQIMYDVHVADAANPLLQPSIVGAHLQGIPHASRRYYNGWDGVSEANVDMYWSDWEPQYTFYGLQIYDRYWEYPSKDETDVSDQEVFSSRYEILDVTTIIELVDFFGPGDETVPDTEISYIQQSFGIYSPASIFPPGDFNADGHVNAADYTVWRNNLGDETEVDIYGNGDGMNGVDHADFLVWKAAFNGGGGSGGGALNGGVPEPPCAILVILAVTLITSSRIKV